MVREQLFQPHQVLLRHHARRAQLTLTLARLLGEDVTTMGLGSFEPFGSLAKTLRRCPVGLQLGHNNSELHVELSLGLALGVLEPPWGGTTAEAVAHFLCRAKARPTAL